MTHCKRFLLIVIIVSWRYRRRKGDAHVRRSGRVLCEERGVIGAFPLLLPRLQAFIYVLRIDQLSVYIHKTVCAAAFCGCKSLPTNPSSGTQSQRHDHYCPPTSPPSTYQGLLLISCFPCSARLYPPLTVTRLPRSGTGSRRCLRRRHHTRT